MGEFKGILTGELLKLKRIFLWPVVWLTPLLAGSLTFIILYVRYDYLKGLEGNQDLSPWQLLLLQHHYLWIFFLLLVVIVLAFQLLFIEYKTNHWKHLLALPVSRSKVYLAKGMVAYILCILMIFLNHGILVVAGKFLGFTEKTDWLLLSHYSLNQLPAVFSLLSFQLFLSAMLNNALAALALGLIGIATSFFFAQSSFLSKVIPYTHLIYTLPHATVDTTISLYYGSFLGLLFLFLGLRAFKGQDM